MVNPNLLWGALVRLAAPNPDTDAEIVARWSRDSEYHRLSDDHAAYPMPLKQAKTWLAEERTNSHPFAIRTLAGDHLIGTIGLWLPQWIHGDGWVGIGIGDREYWGKGCGTDAMKITLHYAFAELNLHRVSLSVFAHNRRAIRSYEKAGFVVEGLARHDCRRDGQYWDSVYMGILREEWECANA